MSRPFKNALCLDLRPDSWESRYIHMCKRRAGHAGPHGITYIDGVIIWDGPEDDTKLVRPEEARRLYRRATRAAKKNGSP